MRAQSLPLSGLLAATVLGLTSLLAHVADGSSTSFDFSKASGTAVLATERPASGTIDFETPRLESPDFRLTINPYRDPGTGVVFSGLSFGTLEAEVGLVINGQTSACVPGDLYDQKLGSAPLGSNAVGLSNLPIRADFGPPLVPPCTVSVEFQTGAGGAIRLRLFDDGGNVVAETSELAGPPVETCGFPGDPRAEKRLTVRSQLPVSFAVMDVPNSYFVYVIDNLTYSSTEAQPATVSLNLDPNVINLKSHAPWVTAYIEPSGFGPTDINLSTLRLAGSVPAAPKFAVAGDHDSNGMPDLMVKFSREALNPLLILGVNELEVTGSLVTGEEFKGRDSVRVSNPPSAPLSASVAPNPLNPAGVLSFNPSRPGRARVAIFDAQGRMIRVLMDVPTLPMGSHAVPIDGRGERGQTLASGPYFYREEAAE